MYSTLARFSTADTAHFANLPPLELAHLFSELGLINAQLDLLAARWWLNQKNKNLNFKEFLAPFIAEELQFNPQYLDFMQKINPENFEPIKKETKVAQDLVISIIMARPISEKKIFCNITLKLICEIFEFENKLLAKYKSKDEYLDFSVYRSYDALDKVLGIDYLLDQKISFSPSDERTYAGAGVGVQSSYSTFLTALRFLDLPPGSKIVDLGSGYGRLGFIIGILRPDLAFTGYEIIKERVAQSQRISEDFGLEKSVHFIEQDLGQDSFVLPIADLYYLYDPFSDATYKKIFSAIKNLPSSKKVQIATKGNANIKMQQEFIQLSWHKSAEFHSGNLCIYSNV